MVAHGCLKATCWEKVPKRTQKYHFNPPPLGTLLGTCWGTFSFKSTPRCPKRLPRGLLEVNLAEVGSNLAIVGSSWSQVRPTWPQDGSKMAPRDIKNIAKVLYCRQIIRFSSFHQKWPKLAQVGPKLGPSWANLAQVGPKLGQVGPKLAQVGPKLAPSWPQVGPSWPQVGPKLEASGAKLAPSWPKLAPCWVLWAHFSETILQTSKKEP